MAVRSPNPFEDYEDVTDALEERGRAAYPEVEMLLNSALRTDFQCAFLRAVSGVEEAREVSIPTRSEIPPHLLPLIERVTEEGLCPLREEISPAQVAEILGDQRALQYAHLCVISSTSEYWRAKRRLSADDSAAVVGGVPAMPAAVASSHRADAAKSQRRMLACTIASLAACALATTSLVWQVLSDRPATPEGPRGFSPSLAGQLLLQNDALQRFNQRIFPAVFANYDEDRGEYLRASYDLHQSDLALAQRVSTSTLRSSSSGDPQAFEEAVLLYVLELLQKHHGESFESVNAETQPGIQDSGAAAREYFYAAMAVERMNSLLRPSGAPSDARKIEVRVELDDAAMFQHGRLTFRLRGADSPETRVEFHAAAPPVPLMSMFSHPENLHGDPRASTVGRASVFEFPATVAPFSMISLVAQNNQVDKLFGGGPSGIAEVCFETRAEHKGNFALPPLVRFTVGGRATAQSGSPPLEVGSQWQQVVIPIDLRGATEWPVLLSIVVNGVSGDVESDESLSILIRDAYVRVRPISAAPSLFPKEMWR